ncbi:hypothetical protein F5Y16DRAFT_141824 [Xylariaceae sp. FL0255]|nr:hypothetical protein F5Y16DRAFT_141824 [Xylariaceae sp. FL0255]
MGKASSKGSSKAPASSLPLPPGASLRPPTHAPLAARLSMQRSETTPPSEPPALPSISRKSEGLPTVPPSEPPALPSIAHKSEGLRTVPPSEPRALPSTVRKSERLPTIPPSEPPALLSIARKSEGLRTVAPSLSAALPSVALGSTGLRSIYQDPEDLKKAEQQLNYSNLTGGEKAKQDKWAMKKADSFAPCPAGFPWYRNPDERYPGYRCEGGKHFMSDGLLAEGIPGMYVYRNSMPGMYRLVETGSGEDRDPTPSERVIPGFYGPARPVGVDPKGIFVYYKEKIDHRMTKKVDPLMQKALGWMK